MGGNSCAHFTGHDGLDDRAVAWQLALFLQTAQIVVDHESSGLVAGQNNKFAFIIPYNSAHAVRVRVRTD
ncbi:hypothetical protein D3C71_2115280 [compost metagenome]